MVKYKCLYCSRIFNHKAFYKTHEEKCLEKFNKTINKFKSYNRIDLLRDFFTGNVITNKTYDCPNCAKKYNSYNGLKSHKLKCKETTVQKLVNIINPVVNNSIVQVNPIINNSINPVINNPIVQVNPANSVINNRVVPSKYKKQPIPINLKKTVWNKWIGEEIGKTNCMCCKVTSITQLSFHCGHVVAEAKGGKLHVDNLRPICGQCNSSMGTTNMNEYIEKYGFGQLV